MVREGKEETGRGGGGGKKGIQGGEGIFKRMQVYMSNVGRGIIVFSLYTKDKT